MRLFKNSLVVLLAVFSLSAQARGFGDFDVFSFGNITSEGSYYEGRVAALGTIKLENFSVSAKRQGSNVALAAGRDLSFSEGVVCGGARAQDRADVTQCRITGALWTGHIQRFDSCDVDGRVSLTGLSARSQFERELATRSELERSGEEIRAKAAALGNLPLNAKAVIQGQTLILEAPKNAKLAVFFVDSDSLFRAKTVRIVADRGQQMVIQISPSGRRAGQGGHSSLSWDPKLEVRSTDGNSRSIGADSVVWSFSGFDDLTLHPASNGFYGEILAPEADVRLTTGCYESRVYVRNLEGPGRIHLPGSACDSNSRSVPEWKSERCGQLR